MTWDIPPDISAAFEVEARKQVGKALASPLGKRIVAQAKTAAYGAVKQEAFKALPFVVVGAVVLCLAWKG